MAGMVNPEAVPDAPPGVLQRGETPPPPAPTKKAVGRPKIEAREGAKRVSVALDPETFKRLAYACIDLGIDRQTLLEQAVAEKLAKISAK